LATYWQYSDVTGPDVAGSTVQPHQFLDYLSGRLHTHFINDARSLAHRTQALEQTRDPDGRYRVQGLFCRAHSWPAALPELLRGDNTVLMDLRSFSPTNAGYVHELQFLIEHIEFGRCLLVVDSTTDIAFLDSTLAAAWTRQGPSSPNYNNRFPTTSVYSLLAGKVALTDLLTRMFKVTQGRVNQ
jgi:hypothetical protein